MRGLVAGIGRVLWGALIVNIDRVLLDRLLPRDLLGDLVVVVRLARGICGHSPAVWKLALWVPRPLHRGGPRHRRGCARRRCCAFRGRSATLARLDRHRRLDLTLLLLGLGKLGFVVDLS